MSSEWQNFSAQEDALLRQLLTLPSDVVRFMWRETGGLGDCLFTSVMTAIQAATGIAFDKHWIRRAVVNYSLGVIDRFAAKADIPEAKLAPDDLADRGFAVNTAQWVALDVDDMVIYVA